MRVLAVLVVFALSAATQASVWTTVYRYDGTTPLAPADPNYPDVYRDIMVGTRLVIVVSSDTAESWVGALESSHDAPMSLTGRGYDSTGRIYVDSCLPAAGPWVAEVRSLVFTSYRGFGLATDFFPSVGDWFIFDYRAERVGSCDLKLYEAYDLPGVPIDELPPIEAFPPIETLSFSHVPSCDFNGDGIVDFEDFTLLASHNAPVPGPVPNSQSTSFDLNSDGAVDFRDVVQFSGHWLERTAGEDSAADPNQPVGF